MSGLFPHRTAFSVPDALINEYKWIADSLLDSNDATVCKLIYPPKHDECENCIYSPQTNRSSGIYKSGGLYPFTTGTLCPFCGGEGRLTIPQEEAVRVRFYAKPSKYLSLEVRLANPDGKAYLIAYISDLPKFQRAVEIVVNSPLRGIKQWKYQFDGGPQPHGLGHDRYFIQLLQRSGG